MSGTGSPDELPLDADSVVGSSAPSPSQLPLSDSEDRGVAPPTPQELPLSDNEGVAGHGEVPVVPEPPRAPPLDSVDVPPAPPPEEGDDQAAMDIAPAARLGMPKRRGRGRPKKVPLVALLGGGAEPGLGAQAGHSEPALARLAIAAMESEPALELAQERVRQRWLRCWAARTRTPAPLPLAMPSCVQRACPKLKAKR